MKVEQEFVNQNRLEGHVRVLMGMRHGVQRL